MKTIRTNCFETNSSSTHSYTVNAPSDLSPKPAQTFVTEDGIVRAKQAGEPSDSLLGKLTFLLTATYFIGDQAAFDRVVKVVEEFAKVKLEITNLERVNSKRVEGPVTKVLDHGGAAKSDDDDDGSEHPAAETIRDEYCSWVNEAGHENADDLINEVNEIVSKRNTRSLCSYSLTYILSEPKPTTTYYNQ